jgi:hypothetical protein
LAVFVMSMPLWWLCSEASPPLQAYFIAKDTGALHEEVGLPVPVERTSSSFHRPRLRWPRLFVCLSVCLVAQVPGAVNPMSNPMGMVDMMKGQAYFAVTQMGMMQFAEAFFSGFVLGE